MQSINAAMCHTLGTLDTQANILASYGEQKAKDSKSIRALTTVATLYLPASLVATIFSSSIVQLLPTMPPRQPSHFVAAPQTWLPVTATLSLMAVTLISVYILERVYRYFKWTKRKGFNETTKAALHNGLDQNLICWTACCRASSTIDLLRSQRQTVKAS